ncbi:cytochrome b/b6 domain-containing protein [Modestobacter sp. VKM Ac-2983]|uniref:cytochrome b/b6 domain-containing protein n=1 Tax=Modestobacter sp. VKM Ac-2983 TaxID=3004137 RepID=UPI002F26B7B4
MPERELWTAEDEIQPYSPWISLPGRNNLGLGRHWHFWSVTGWIVVGALYVVLLVVTPQWRRLVPTSWEVFPDAWAALTAYLRLELPEHEGLFNGLQQLAYFGVVFVLAPFQILTGFLMSPGISGRFPWLPRLFGGRQAVRSLHFLGLVAFVAFFLVHVALVVWHGFGEETAQIVLGSTGASDALAIAVVLVGIAGVLAFNVWATRASLRSPDRVKGALEVGVDPVRRGLFHRCGIEFVADFADVGQGQGGWRDDVLHYHRSGGGI